MALKFTDGIDIANFTIENNILKGIDIDYVENSNIGEVILNTLNSSPDHVAQIDAETDHKTTFAEMKDRSVRCALWMKEYGVKSGDIVIVCSHNHLDTYVPFFATFYVGATVNGWDHELGLKSARHLMNLFGPKLVFACESAVEVLLEAAKLENVKTNLIVFGNYSNIKSLDDILQALYDGEIRLFRPVQIQNPDDISIILLTSGSTGTPKGVMHSYKNFLKLVRGFTVYPYKGVSLCTSTLYWLTGIMVMFVSTFTKGTRIILKKWDVDVGCQVIQKYKRTFMSAVAINQLLKSNVLNKYNLESLEIIGTGGAKINREIFKEFKQKLPNAFIYQAYGSSETGLIIASQVKKTKNIDSVGIVIANTEVKIIDVDNNKILGPNQEGEICVKQPTLMLGYYKNVEEIKNAVDEDGWLHTGDKGYFDQYGEITVTDRLKNVIKCRSYQISPAELEEVLSSHPAVFEVAVVPIPHDMDKQESANLLNSYVNQILIACAQDVNSVEPSQEAYAEEFSQIMSINISNKLEIEDFRIDENILKGIKIELERKVNIGEVILASLNSAPDHISQIDAETDEKTTSADMRDCSIRCALWMREKEIKSGDIVIVCSHNHINTYVPALATFYVGAIFNGWDHQISLKSACYFMKLLEPKVIFACESIVDTLLKAAKSESVITEIVVFGKYPGLQSLDDLLQLASKNEIRDFYPLKMKNPEETAIIILTSGSSGFPKAVMHSYGKFLNLVQTFSVYPMTGVLLCNSTFYWLSGIMMLLVSMFTLGTRIVLKTWDIEKGCRVVEKYKVRSMLISPIVITYLVKSKFHEHYNLSSVKLVFTGGSIIKQKTIHGLQEILPNALIISGYGLTETGRMASSQTEYTRNFDSVGVVTSNTEIKIQDMLNKQTLGANQEGEICIRQPTIMTGYFKDPEETKKVIDEEGWLHTGDMGYYDDNGELIVTGRYKDVIKCRDYQMSPAELEEVLLSHPAVMEVAVVPIAHDIDVEQPMAFVKKSSDVSESELVELSLILGDHKKLRGGVEFVDEMPKTPSGKINKRIFKKMAEALKTKRDFGTE